MDPQWGIAETPGLNGQPIWRGILMLFKLLKSAKFYPGILQETIYMGC